MSCASMGELVVSRKGIDLSVVVPVYGCEMCLRALFCRVQLIARKLKLEYEVVLIDDRGPDNSWAVIKELADSYPEVKAVRLSRNFGQHRAISAGLSLATGNRIVVMDCDLQEAPEEIERLWERAEQGFDIVLAKRLQKRQSALRRWSAKIYFKLLNRMSGSNLEGEFGTFSLISMKVAQAYLKMGDRDRHYLLVLNWLGFNTGFIEYCHAERHSGESSYTIKRLVRHALEGIFFQTTVLLRWVIYGGMFLSGFGILSSIFLVYQYLTRPVMPGWTSVVVLLFILCGFVIMSTGITGLYIGKIFEQVKGRPLFVVDEIYVPKTLADVRRDAELEGQISSTSVLTEGNA